MVTDDFEGNSEAKRAYIKQEIENARKKESKITSNSSNEAPIQENNWTAGKDPKVIKVMYLFKNNSESKNFHFYMFWIIVLELTIIRANKLFW